MKRQDVTIFLLSLLIILLLLFRVFHVAELGATDITYSSLQEQISTVKRENINLRAQILHESSLSTIEAKARSEGFIDVTYYYLK